MGYRAFSTSRAINATTQLDRLSPPAAAMFSASAFRAGPIRTMIVASFFSLCAIYALPFVLRSATYPLSLNLSRTTS